MVATSTYLIVFRIVHILAGVAWAGSSFLFVGFIGPAASEIGPAAGPLMANLVEKRKVTNVIEGTASFTVLAGLFLYWHDWHAVGSFGDWIGTRFGLVLTIGGVAAIIAFFLGTFGIKPSVERMVALGGEMAASGGPPAPELMGEMQQLQGRLKVIGQADLAFLAIAILGMATARYW